MVVLLVLGGLFAVLAVMRIVGVDGISYTAIALTLTPYGVAVGAVLGAIAATAHQWWIAGPILGLTVVLAALVMPRTVRRSPSTIPGRRLRLMSSNLYMGRADVKTVIRLVEEYEVEILNLVELTPEVAADLERAGLFEMLPHRVLRPAGTGTGAGVASRYPLTELTLVGPSSLAQPSVRVDLHGTGLEIVAVHPLPPTRSFRIWRNDMAALPLPSGTARILAGDFNATRDHAAFRRLLRAGYVDAGEHQGAGLVATWPCRCFPLPVTLDHVLVDDRIGVLVYRTLTIPGSDHKALYAELAIPDPATPTSSAREPL
jgi:endonuclease/exonuclease/phosphatase (EEP) superfamily protein YafD